MNLNEKRRLTGRRFKMRQISLLEVFDLFLNDINWEVHTMCRKNTFDTHRQNFLPTLYNQIDIIRKNRQAGCKPQEPGIHRHIADNGMSLHEYGIPGQVIHTPGHSMGHISILLDSGDAIVGDMAMNSWFLRLTPGLPVLADDINLVVQSWKKILPMGVKRIFPAHGMDFPVGVIQKEIENFK